jgi:hypothetical protein
VPKGHAKLEGGRGRGEREIEQERQSVTSVTETHKFKMLKGQHRTSLDVEICV